MSVEERLARLETRFESQNDWLKSIADDVKALRDQANAGKGALMLLLKLGSVAAVIVAAIAWVFEKFHIK